MRADRIPDHRILTSSRRSAKIRTIVLLCSVQLPRGATVESPAQDPGRVVELFAGVGGFRLGLEQGAWQLEPDSGWTPRVTSSPVWEVVWGNQWEPSTKSQPAFECYSSNFDGRGTHVNEDIAEVLNRSGVPRYDGATVAPWDQIVTGGSAIPQEFDLLVGGFPCQDYSVAKPLRQSGGLGGEKGILWWEIARILQQYRPPHVLLENVDRLLKSPSQQRGRDFAVILACFAQLGYSVEWRVINAADYGFPQRRRRVFIYATRRGAWFEALGIEEAEYRIEPERWRRVLETSGGDGITKLGVLASALPCVLRSEELHLEILGRDGTVDPYEVSSDWSGGKQSVWANAGVMVGGVALTAHVDSAFESEGLNLSDVVLPVDVVIDRYPEFIIPAAQLDWSEAPRTSSWNYLKGSKREPRSKMVNGEKFSYYYTEGAVAFPEPLEGASRTVLTGEGGTSPSRFKHVIRQPLPERLIDDEAMPESVRSSVVAGEDGEQEPGLYRRLTPTELERLNGFPDGWTAGMRDGRRAFCMGNALVVGLVEMIGGEIAARRRATEG